MATIAFEGDTLKSETNRAKHGLDFEQAIALFDDVGGVDVEVHRPGAKELRRKRIARLGRSDERLYTVVYVRRGDALRLISARRASVPERRLHAGAQTD